MVRYSFPVGLLHSLLHAGLSRRTRTTLAYAKQCHASLVTFDRTLLSWLVNRVRLSVRAYSRECRIGLSVALFLQFA
jgi:hypothetical protein